MAGVLCSTCMKGDVLGDAKRQAAHDARNMCAMPVAVVRIVIIVHRVAVDGPTSCSRFSSVQEGHSSWPSHSLDLCLKKCETGIS